MRKESSKTGPYPLLLRHQRRWLALTSAPTRFPTYETRGGHGSKASLLLPGKSCAWPARMQTRVAARRFEGLGGSCRSGQSMFFQGNLPPMRPTTGVVVDGQAYLERIARDDPRTFCTLL